MTKIWLILLNEKSGDESDTKKETKMGKYNYYLYELTDTGFILFDFPFDMQSPFRQEFIDCFSLGLKVGR